MRCNMTFQRIGLDKTTGEVAFRVTIFPKEGKKVTADITLSYDAANDMARQAMGSPFGNEVFSGIGDILD